MCPSWSRLLFGISPDLSAGWCPSQEKSQRRIRLWSHSHCTHESVSGWRWRLPVRNWHFLRCHLLIIRNDSPFPFYFPPATSQSCTLFSDVRAFGDKIIFPIIKRKEKKSSSCTCSIAFKPWQVPALKYPQIPVFLLWLVFCINPQVSEELLFFLLK